MIECHILPQNDVIEYNHHLITNEMIDTFENENIVSPPRLPYSVEQRRGELSEKGVKTKDLIALCAEAKLTGSYKNKSKVELIELLVAHGKDEYNAYLKKQGLSSKINYAALSNDGSNDESNFLIKPSSS